MDNQINRKITKSVNIGGVTIGGGAEIFVQSMTNTKTTDALKTIEQINSLKAAGCDIVRVAVPDIESAECIYEIKNNTNIPLVADIHFDYRLAIACIERGIDKIRINPGNIGDEDKVKLVVNACKTKGIPIRIGVNSGSVPKDLLSKYNSPCAEAMIESAVRHIEILEGMDFSDIVISLKSSSVLLTIESYRLMSERYNYPLHLGVTEAGTTYSGTVKSAIGIGTLLAEGIGDTLRVSLTADPVAEVLTGIEILKALGLRKGVEIISCPTCARCNIDLIPLANEVNKLLAGSSKNIKVAIMGCAVNGPGEAREADIGIAGGMGEGLLFKKGETIRKIREQDLLNELMKEIELL